MIKSEFGLIEKIKRKIPRDLQGTIPIGDDAGAWMSPSGKQLLFTSDVIVENVDFIRRQLAPEKIGRKALAINLSDMAAMAAEPLVFTIALGIPKSMPEAWILRFYNGLMDLARQYNVSCVGGDVTQAKEFFASIALTGQAAKEEIVRRRGARSGDWIAVTGVLGGSILKNHYAFEPRVEEARFLTRLFRPSAMIDISDGLLQDLEHLLKASGCGADLNVDKIPVSPDAMELSAKTGRTFWEHALTDGEDFELLFTVNQAMKTQLEKAWPKAFPGVKLSWIGRIRSGKGTTFKSKGKTVSLQFKKKGYTHFS